MAEIVKDDDFWKGFIIGQALKPILWRAKEPIGYLYGHVAKEGETPTHTIDGVDYVGVITPKLPEWNKTTHPYAVIGYGDNYGYQFTYSSSQLTANENGEIWPSRFLTYHVSDDTWVSNNGAVSYITPIWTTKDILKENDSIFLAKSDCVCIPIYEGSVTT